MKLHGIACLFAAALPGAGCETDDTTPRTAAAVLRVPLVRDIRTLDPLQGDEITTYNVIRQLYESLVDYDPATLEVAPRLAESWTVSSDGLSWRFRVRPDVSFVDDPCFASGRGRRLTAGDAKFSIERALSVFRGTQDHHELPAIRGLEAFLRGATTVVSGLSIETDQLLEIRLDRPEPTLLHFLARCGIMPHEALELYGDGLSRHAVGSGPFRLVSWQPLSGILLVRNRSYWGTDDAGARLPYLDAVRLVPASHQHQFRLYARGEIDVALSYSRAFDPGLESGSAVSTSGSAGPGEQRHLVPRLNTIYLRFDYRSSHPMVRERALRRVLVLAAPRPTGLQRPAAGLLPPGLPGFDSSMEGQRTDRPQAKRLLAQAGHPGGSGLPPLRIAWPEWDGAAGRRVAAAIEELGLGVEFSLHSDRQYWTAVEAQQVDAFRAGWMADYPDPLTFLQLFYGGALQNVGAYANAEFDALFERFREEPDLDRRLELARQLERLLLDDAASVFLHHDRESQLVSSGVDRWENNGTNPLSVIYYERIAVRPRPQVR